MPITMLIFFDSIVEGARAVTTVQIRASGKQIKLGKSSICGGAERERLRHNAPIKSRVPHVGERLVTPAHLPSRRSCAETFLLADAVENRVVAAAGQRESRMMAVRRESSRSCQSMSDMFSEAHGTHGSVGAVGESRRFNAPCVPIHSPATVKRSA